MKRDDKWELDIGRYSNQNYAIGRALDPQTWQPISDHELQLLAAHFRDKPEFAASMNDLAMASIFEKAGSPDRADAAYASAIQTCPQNPEAWERRGDFLARINAPPEERKKLHEEAVRRLGSSPDLKVRHQTALADLHREGGDQSSAKKVEQTIIAQNRRNRSDLGVSVAAQKVNSAIDSGDLDAAAAEFHRQLYALGKNSGGDFLKQVGLPFIQALMKNGKNVRARRAIGTMRQQLSPDPGSLLDMALKDLEQSTR
jgi:tetratricopeptide (TPR) repeat protein